MSRRSWNFSLIAKMNLGAAILWIAATILAWMYYADDTTVTWALVTAIANTFLSIYWVMMAVVMLVKFKKMA